LIGGERLAAELVCSDDKEAIRLWITDVDDTQVAPGGRLADGHSSVVDASAILAWLAQNLLLTGRLDPVCPPIGVNRFPSS
jgi:hypothetical protein